jgi:energy-converting hydrogenase A subunit R
MPHIFFDLEGPLSPQDNAYEVLGLAENGSKVFEIISKYDDLLTLEGRANYEPGDTLKLIVPFLILHNITDEDIRKVSERAKIVSGAREIISTLKSEGWEVYIISTSYQQHAYNIARQVGVEEDRVACTKLSLNKYIAELGDEELAEVERIESKILTDLYPRMDEQEIVRTLDNFFFKKLRDTRLGDIFNQVTIIGGRRKVEAMKRFLSDQDYRDVVAVGDSITDYKMLEEVREGGGLAVAFNGNEYSIPYADVALASIDQRFSYPIAEAFKKGGKRGALDVCRELERRDLKSLLSSLPPQLAEELSPELKPPRYRCLENASQEVISETIKIHKEYRMLVRGEAGKLG